MMDDEETSDMEEEIYKSKDRGKKSSKSKKQSSKESTKKDGFKNRYATTMYVGTCWSRLNALQKG